MPETTHTRLDRLGYVAICFLLSGFAALLYETVWVRQFAIVFGTSEQALAVVLSTYMGGLAIGSLIASKTAPTLRRPLLTYGLLELGIAITALLVPVGLVLARAVQVWLFAGNDEPPAAGNFSQILYFFLSAFVLTILPTSMMGATLPMLARYAVRSDDHLGKRIGSLYAINVVGAVLGTLTAAYVALPHLGLSKTIWIGAICNLFVFGFVWLLNRQLEDVQEFPSEPTTTADETSQAFQSKTTTSGVDEEIHSETDGHPNPKSSKRTHRKRRRGGETRSNKGSKDPLVSGGSTLDSTRWILPTIAISGAISFVYEILFTRMLGHLLGGSIFAFASMLASFLMGIALGAAIASRLASSIQRAARVFVYAQFSTALLALVSWHSIEWLASLSNSYAATESNLPIPRSLLAIIVLLPPAITIGMTFPLAIRIHARGAQDAANSSASVYAWNTFGGVVGAFVAGAYLLPSTSYGLTLVAAACVNILLAIVAMLNSGVRPLPTLAGLLSAAVIAMGFPGTPQELLRSSSIPRWVRDGNLAFSKTGRSSTVTVHHQVGAFMFATNGLPEAGTTPIGHAIIPTSAPIWLGVLPCLVQPNAESMLVIGFGSGVAATSALDTVKSIDVFELEEGVIVANELVSTERLKDPLSDRRLNIIMNDGRSGLAMTKKKYDAIVSQPSHPWTAGASHLYTREFAELVHDHLQPEGVFVLWMDSSFIDLETFRSLGASLLDVFPSIELYQPATSTLLFVARNQSSDLDHADLDLNVFGDQSRLNALGINSPEALAPLRSLDEQAFRELCEGATPTTDDNNRMAMRMLVLDPKSPEQQALRDAIADHDIYCGDAAPSELPVPREYVARRRHSIGRTENAQRVAAAIQSPSEQALLEGYFRYSLNDFPAAAAKLQQAMNLSSDNKSAASLMELLAVQQPSVAADAGYVPGSVELSGFRADVIEAAKLLQRDDYASMKELDEKLAQVPPTDVLHPTSLQLRIQWRIEDTVSIADLERGEQILKLVDQAIPHLHRALVLPQRMIGAKLANRPLDLLGSIQMLLKDLNDPEAEGQVSDDAAKAALLRNCQAALRSIEGDPRVPAYRSYAVTQLLQQSVDKWGL